MFGKIPLLWAIAAAFISGGANANPADSSDLAAGAQIASQLRHQLSMRYPGTRIQVGEQIQWARGSSLPQEPGPARILSESQLGTVQFSVEDVESGRVSEGVTTFSAWVPAWVATRRVQPGETISREMFTAQEINIARGQAREFRGVVMSAQEGELNGLEARQTILPGQFLMTTAVQKTPDIRRGDAVTLRLKSVDLTLTTPGIAQEPALLNGTVRVLTAKTKRELHGRLVEPGIVEVKL